LVFALLPSRPAKPKNGGKKSERVKKSLESDYPRPLAGALRPIRGFATAISDTRPTHAFIPVHRTGHPAYSSEDPSYAEVDTKIVTENRPPLSINYKLQSVNKEWKVYDLVIGDISVVNNYRSQFDRAITRSSFEELVRTMKEKHS
jgi:hypothetical protein